MLEKSLDSLVYFHYQIAKTDGWFPPELVENEIELNRQQQAIFPAKTEEPESRTIMAPII